MASAAGDYRFEVVGNEGTPPGKYEIRIEEKRAATDADRRRVEGERTFLEGYRLQNKNKLQEAFAHYGKALTLWKEAGYRLPAHRRSSRGGRFSLGKSGSALREISQVLRQRGRGTGR